MKNIVKTVYGAQVQLAAKLGQVYQYQSDTTINEVLNVNTNVLPTGNPILSYIGIGNGGHSMLLDASGNYIPEANQHLATDAVLFNMIPYVIVPTTDDLPSVEQANYGLKQSLTLGSPAIDYFAYYLKAIDSTQLTTTAEILTLSPNTSGGYATTTISDFIPSGFVPNPISPTPTTSSGGNLTLQNTYIRTTTKIQFTMSQQDITYFNNVLSLLPQAKNVPIISELALCLGEYNSEVNDVVGVMVDTFISSLFIIDANTNEINYEFEYGTTLPLFNLIPS